MSVNNKKARPNPMPMATTTYRCKECRTNLNLSDANLYPPEVHFEAGNKNTLSFKLVDHEKFKFKKKNKIMPFFETLNYWGIQRKRTKIMCLKCGLRLGYVYDDGPPLTDDSGHHEFGLGQVIPRRPRCRFKTKSLLIAFNT